MATAGYHDWIRTQDPVERWSLRLATAAGAYDRALDHTQLHIDDAVNDAEDRLRELADQATHHLGARDSRLVRLAAVGVGAAFNAVGHVLDAGGDREHFHEVTACYGRAVEALREELRATAVPS